MKIAKTILLLFFIVFTRLSLAQSGDTVFINQTKMEDALKNVNTINDLLDNPTVLENYYQAVNDYYRNKIIRANFDNIIKQIRVLSNENPEFGERLLRDQRDLKSYSITSDIKTYGQTLNQNIWIQKKRVLFGELGDLDISLDQIKSKLAVLSDDIKRFEHSIANSSKQKSAKERSQYYNQIREKNRTLFKKIVSTIFYLDPEIQSLALSNDADLVIFILERGLKDKIRKLDIPQNILSLIVSEVPKPNDLLDLKVLEQDYYYTQRGIKAVVEPLSATKYNFVPFKRPLHAVWKGVWLGECVGGGSVKSTPRRWATVVLNNVNNYAVEKNNVFIGFIQELGIKKPESHSIYYATEFGAPALKGNILVFDSKTDFPVKVSMLDKWLEAAPKNILRVKSESESINNAGVIPVLTNSTQGWNFRISKGQAEEYQLADQKFADFIISSSSKNKFSIENSYGKGIISDATVPGANELKTIVSVHLKPLDIVKMMSKTGADDKLFSTLVQYHPQLFVDLDKDKFLTDIFEKMRYSRSLEFCKIMERLNYPASKREYFYNLLEHQKFESQMEKILFLDSVRGLMAALDYTRRMPLSQYEIHLILTYFKSTNMFNSNLGKNILPIVYQRIIDERIQSAYPMFVEYIELFDDGYKFRSLIVDRLSELDLDETHLLLEMLPFFMKHLWLFSENLQVGILNRYMKLGLNTELRKSLLDRPEFSLINDSISNQFLRMLLKDSILSRDIELLNVIFKEGSDLTYLGSDHLLHLLNYAVTEIIKTEDLKLFELLNAKIFFLFSQKIFRREKILSDESQLWYELMVKNRGNERVNIEELLFKYQSYKSSHMSCQIVL